MALNDIHRCTFIHRTPGGQNCVNVLHVKEILVTSGGATREEMADEISTGWATAVKSVIAPTVEYQGMKFDRVTAPLLAQIQTQVGADFGNLIGDPLPSHVTFLMSLRSNSAPRGIRGRVYLPPATEAENTSAGRPDAAYIAAVATAFDAYLQTDFQVSGATGATDLQFVIYAGTTSTLSYPITNVLYRTEWASQKRRRPISQPDTPQF